MRLDVLARQIGATVAGDLAVEVASVASLDRAQMGEVTFDTDATHISACAERPQTALIVTPTIADRAEHKGLHLLVA